MCWEAGWRSGDDAALEVDSMGLNLARLFSVTLGKSRTL